MLFPFAASLPGTHLASGSRCWLRAATPIPASTRQPQWCGTRCASSKVRTAAAQHLLLCVSGLGCLRFPPSSNMSPSATTRLIAAIVASAASRSRCVETKCISVPVGKIHPYQSCVDGCCSAPWAKWVVRRVGSLPAPSRRCTFPARFVAVGTFPLDGPCCSSGFWLICFRSCCRLCSLVPLLPAAVRHVWHSHGRSAGG